MTNIPDTEYITVNKDGIFVGGKPATTYRGQKMCCDTDYMKRVFAWMQEQNPEIEEFHIGAFATSGKRAKPGNPDGLFGPSAWCRVKYKDGNLGAWVFLGTSGSAAYCANFCAFYCASSVRNDVSFRSAVFGLIDNQGTKQKQPRVINKQKQPRVIKLPWHIITIARRDKQK